MKRESNSKKIKISPSLLILFFLAVSIGAFFTNTFDYIDLMAVTGLGKSPGEEAKNAYEDCGITKPGRSRDKVQCYSQFFYNLTKKTNTEFAFATVFELQKVDTYAEGCHVIAHGIGWSAYDRNPKELHETLRSIPKQCSFGAVHGIIERYGKSNNGVVDKAIIPRICGEKPPIGCVHAVGHILLVQTENDLEKATQLCEVFPLENNKRRSCLTGVYMERMIGPNLFAHGMITNERRYKWHEHMDEFDALCRKARGEKAVSCWEKIALPASIKAKDDPYKLFEYCETAQDQESRNYCKVLGLAEIVIRSSYDLEAYKNVCEMPQQGFPEFKKECHQALVKTTMLSLPPEKLKRVTDFCQSLPNVDKQECFRAINESFSRLSYRQKDINTVCGYIDEAYKSMCMGENDAENKNASDIEVDVHKI